MTTPRRPADKRRHRLYRIFAGATRAVAQIDVGGSCAGDRKGRPYETATDSPGVGRHDYMPPHGTRRHHRRRGVVTPPYEAEQVKKRENRHSAK